jgi:hypothetical protein
MPRNLPRRCRECGIDRTTGAGISRTGLCAPCAAAAYTASVMLPAALRVRDTEMVQEILGRYGYKVTLGGGVGGARSNRARRTPKVPVA